MPISEITLDVIKNYLRLDETDEADNALLENLKTVAINYICDYTAILEENLDNYESFYIVVLILIQDMYDNRTLYVDKNNLNKVVGSILDMHRLNLI